MKKAIYSIASISLFTAFVFSACNKSMMCKEEEEEMGHEDAVIVLEKNGFESKIITPLEKPNDFEYYTKGVIEYSKDGQVVATVDFGNGEKDVIAKKKLGASIEDIDLSAKKKKSKYTKVITSPLVKTNECEYIVAGTIKYYEGKTWVATVDYGNGNCDEMATKTWKDGSKQFSLAKKK